jgi:hypothetical protein
MSSVVPTLALLFFTNRHISMLTVSGVTTGGEGTSRAVETRLSSPVLVPLGEKALASERGNNYQLHDQIENGAFHF